MSETKNISMEQLQAIAQYWVDLNDARKIVRGRITEERGNIFVTHVQNDVLEDSPLKHPVYFNPFTETTDAPLWIPPEDVGTLFVAGKSLEQIRDDLGPEEYRLFVIAMLGDRLMRGRTIGLPVVSVRETGVPWALRATRMQAGDLVTVPMEMGGDKMDLKQAKPIKGNEHVTFPAIMRIHVLVPQRIAGDRVGTGIDWLVRAAEIGAASVLTAYGTEGSDQNNLRLLVQKLQLEREAEHRR